MNALEKGYRSLIFLASFLKSPLLLACRLYWGALFAIAGWGKLADIPHFEKLLENYHIIFPHFTAYLVAYTELIGGICLFLGLGARLVAIPLIITMITAYFTVHAASLQVLFHKPSVFVAESPFNFLLASLLILAFGPGRFSIDFLLERAFFSKKQSSSLSKEG
jgi:putative oxidoreductase